MDSKTMSFKPYSKSNIRRKKQKVSEKKKSFYHSAHGALSTSLFSNIPEWDDNGFYETHFVNGENKDKIVAPITLEKDVSGISATITFKINADMCTTTLTSDNSAIETEGEQLNNIHKFHTLFTIEVEGHGNQFIITKVLVHSPSMVEDGNVDYFMYKK